MSNNVTLNIVEPGSPTPDPVVPNTGLFTSGIGGPEATVITAVSAVLILTIAAIVVAFLYRKQKKSGKVTKLVHLVDSTKAVLKSKKRITAGLSAIALLASAGTLTTLLANAGKSNTNAADDNDSLTLDVSSEELTIEVGDAPVFAILPVEVTVEEATEAGYTLTAYTDNTDLVSTTDSSKVIPMVAADEGELVTLANNTYGLALEEKPTTKDEAVYTSLSTDLSNPTILKAIDDYSSTPASDTTTIYYGFYITPDIPYGTYAGSDINYEAKENEVATVTFDGNGKYYFGNDDSKTTNIMEYVPDAVLPETVAYSHTPNINNNGGQGGAYPLNSAQTFVYRFDGADRVYVDFEKVGTDGECGPDGNDYFTFWSGFHPDYTAASYETTNPILAFGNTTGKYVFGNYSRRDDLATDVDSSSLTIAYATSGSRGSYCGNPNHGYGYYAAISATNADGENVNVIGNDVLSGEYMVPNTNTESRFIGWSTNPNDTKAMYYGADDIKFGLNLDLNDNITLYAISEPGYVIYYNGNGADITSNMDNAEQYTTDLESTEKQVDLLASNFKKEGYGFAGWSIDQNAWEHFTDDDESNNSIIYGPNQTITVDPSASTKLNLYAVWVPVETNVTMQTFNPNSEPYASKPNGTVIALKDERDNEVYAVAKLADGNYWMIENLRLDNEPELFTTNTHNPSLPLTNNYSEGATSNFLSATSNDWCTDWDSAPCYNQSKLNTNNVANTATSAFSRQDFTNGAHEDLVGDIVSYGNYYNWYSATAGNGKQETTTTVTGDICPAGWILPIGNETDANGSFSHLDVSMGGNGGWQGSTEASNRWRSFPNNFVYSGGWGGSSADYRGGSGYYWSSTAGKTDYAYNLGFYSDSVDPGAYNYGKYYGYSVRCVAPVE